MIKVEFTDEWFEVFKEFGLETFEDFFEYSAGRTINRNKKRDVIMMDLGGRSDRKELFMKRFFCPHFKDMLFTLQNFGRPCSQAACEWENTRILLENGIETYHPVCYGEKMVWGLEKKSFFITEKIQGQCLAELISESWLTMSQEEKEQIIVSLAEMIRRIHDSGISLPDMYVWHVFVTKTNGDYSFAIIDLHRMTANLKGRCGNSERIRNLGAFLFSSSPEYFDEQIKEKFLNAYTTVNWKASKPSFYRKIMKRCELLANRRRR